LRLIWLRYRMNHLYNLAITFLFFLIALAMICYPNETITGATSGLKIFVFVLLPALLPFLILSEILMGLGIVHFIGTLLEPLMRPVFRVPGMGAFAIAMSLSSGYLTGAIITAKLRKDKMCSRVEAERLLSITNVSNPIFILGSVGVGMFHSAKLGITLALAHYLSCLLVGLVFRFYGQKEERTEYVYLKNKNIFIRALQEMCQTRLADGRPLGQILGESVQHAVNNIFLIGGFLILFSVILKLMNILGLITLLCLPVNIFLQMLGFSQSFSPSLINGFIEVTLGSTLASQATAPLWQKIVITSSIIAWSGLSVQAQVASIISRTDIRILPYLSARILHTFFAACLSLLFIQPHSLVPILALPAMTANTNNLFGNYLIYCFSALFLILAFFLAVSLLVILFRKIHLVIGKITK